MTPENPCVIFVANRGFGLTNSRLALVQHFVSSGWRVVAATAGDAYAAQLSAMGVTVEPVSFHRGGPAPFLDAQTLLVLTRIYRRRRPALIHHFNAKPIILGTLAAGFAGCGNVVNTITGLGHSFIQNGPTYQLAAAGYNLLLSRSTATIFQNPDDQRLFVQRGWIPAHRARLIISSGVDSVHFRPAAASGPPAGSPRVLMAARLLWQKGVGEFIEAAEVVKEKYPAACFELAGEWDPVHPDAVDERWIQSAADSGIIEFLGYLSAMQQQLPARDIFVLPSYREGAPRVLLEAAACGLPVVTTDVPGCRDVVVEGVTGLVTPPRDSQALAGAIMKLLQNPELRRQMGRAGRERVEAEFDIRAITGKYLALYREVGIAV
jgi:glycosyltransferase involved in cell wall biosynthesis